MKLLRLCPYVVGLFLVGCGATYQPFVPTDRPTLTPTFTITPSSTPGENVSPTVTPTPPPMTITGGPSPTALFGPTRTPSPDDPTPTRPVNPNAPRIEFFTSSELRVQPGSSVTLYWSTRGADNAVIYRLDSTGRRTLVWNVGPDGNLTISTRSSDRGSIDFLLIVGENALQTEQRLSIPLACPVAWFFSPAPDTCPDTEAQPTRLIEQQFERGRMVYIGARNTVYVLANDGRTPAWIPFENRYDPNIHPESDERFPNPPGLFQPIAVLGFVWRGNDTVRNRLGLGIQQEVIFEGFLQTVTSGGRASLYISSADRNVLQILPDGSGWQIVSLP